MLIKALRPYDTCLIFDLLAGFVLKSFDSVENSIL